MNDFNPKVSDEQDLGNYIKRFQELTTSVRIYEGMTDEDSETENPNEPSQILNGNTETPGNLKGKATADVSNFYRKSSDSETENDQKSGIKKHTQISKAKKDANKVGKPEKSQSDLHDNHTSQKQNSDTEQERISNSPNRIQNPKDKVENQNSPRKGDKYSSGEEDQSPCGQPSPPQTINKERSWEEKGKFTIYAKGIDTNITRINSLKIQKNIDSSIGRRVDVYKSGNSLRIECKNDAEVKELMKEKTIGEYSVNYPKPYQKKDQLLTKERGIIFGVDLEISEEEIKYETGAEAVKRIIKKRGDQTITTEQVILCFEKEMPSYVHIGYRKHRVDRYIPDPIRCYRCQKFGHRAPNCNSKTKCSVCAGPHSVNDCPEIQKNTEESKERKCPNCSGNHPASYKGCPSYKTALQVTKIQFQGPTKMSYAEATKKMKASIPEIHLTKPPSEQSVNNTTKINHPEKPKQPAPPPSEQTETPSESKRNATNLTDHNNCVSKDLFYTFLKKCEEIFRDQRDKSEKEKSFLILIEQVISYINDTNPEELESSTSHSYQPEDENLTNTKWNTINGRK